MNTDNQTEKCDVVKEERKAQLTIAVSQSGSGRTCTGNDIIDRCRA